MFSCAESDIDSQSAEKDTPLFSFISPELSGVRFVNEIKESPQMDVLFYEYYNNGGGVAIGDINNDRLPNIYFTANVTPNKLFLNKGDLKFSDITNHSKTEGEFGITTGVTMADVNADGWLDIYVCRSGKFDADQRRNKLFINNKDLSFTERAAEYGLDDPSYSTQAYFFDYDRDGDLDMYLLNHQIEAPNIPSDEVANLSGGFASDKLFRNDNGYFNDVTGNSGIMSNPISYDLSASISDLNNDGWPDIYVANDFLEHDYLYINQKNGRFADRIHESTKSISFFSMGSDVGDINNDGLLDLIVLDMSASDNYRIKTNMSGMNPQRFSKAVKNGFHYQYMYNVLQLNQGFSDNSSDLAFSEIAQFSGIESTDWSWAPLICDFDNDGQNDLFVSNGMIKETTNNDYLKIEEKYLTDISESKNGGEQSKLIKELLDSIPSKKLKNYFYKNSGNLKLVNVTDRWGINEESFSNGASYGDLDLDGDLDLVINNIDENSFLYENSSHNEYLKFRLIGSKGNPFAIGSRIELKYTDGSCQIKEIFGSRGYLSSVEPIVIFGLADAKEIDSINVIWPDGSTQILTDFRINGDNLVHYELEDKSSRRLEIIANEPYFTNSRWTNELRIMHSENNFNDFDRESLLPHKMSQLGPAMCLADVNGDNLGDIYIGGSKGFGKTIYSIVGGRSL